MNEQTSKLVEQLAQKLGTTSEYLWGILLKQAPISATIDLIYCILVFLMGVLLYRLHIHFSKSGIYEDSDGGIPAAMLIGSIIWSIIAIVCFFCIGGIVTGFVNPEYWALDKILSALKN